MSLLYITGFLWWEPSSSWQDCEDDRHWSDSSWSCCFYCLHIHSFLTLPLIYFMITQKNPFRLLGCPLEALTTSFGTSSRWFFQYFIVKVTPCRRINNGFLYVLYGLLHSSATLPVTLHCMEENLNMGKQVMMLLTSVGLPSEDISLHIDISLSVSELKSDIIFGKCASFNLHFFKWLFEVKRFDFRVRGGQSDYFRLWSILKASTIYFSCKSHIAVLNFILFLIFAYLHWLADPLKIDNDIHF